MIFGDRSKLISQMNKELFFKYLNECYKKVEENCIFYYYNKQYIREKKLCRVLEIDEPNQIDTKDSEIYFEVNKNFNYFLVHFGVKMLLYDYNLTQEENLNVIAEWLKEDYELCNLKPYFYVISAGTYATYQDLSVVKLPTTLNTSLLTFSTKGPINKPIHIKSTSEFLQTFGEYQT